MAQLRGTVGKIQPMILTRVCFLRASGFFK